MSGADSRQEPLIAKSENEDGEVVEGVPIDKAKQDKAEKRSLCISICALAFSIPALIGA